MDNFHTNWSKTAGSTLATVECTGQYTGSASRYCGSDGKWQEPNYSNCTSNSIEHIKEEVNPVYTLITSVFLKWGISLFTAYNEILYQVIKNIQESSMYFK